VFFIYIISEYLLLSELDDKTPSLVLPNRDQQPSLRLPNSEETPKMVLADRGEDANIPCDAGYNVDPNAPVFWYKNGNLMLPADGVNLNYNGLFISSVQPSDAALYTCILGDGEATSSTRLHVTDPGTYPGTILVHIFSY
jgi:hypothetical protein